MNKAEVKCVHCDEPNPEHWFYCRICGKQAAQNKYTSNLWMRTERGKRSDIEFSTMSINDSISSMNQKLN
tara:strand:- start:254 stop:463 length:210 start_codon:yes stop_codon:yes gene_type:complete